MKIILFLFIFYVSLESIVFAEIIKLKTGQVIDGVIIEKSDTVIKVKKDEVVKEFFLSDIKYIRGEGIDRGSAEYYGLLTDAMNEPDTNLDGWKTVSVDKISLKDTPAVKAFDKAKELFQQGQWDECITSLTKAIDGGFNLAEAHFYRANAYYNKRDLNTAIIDFTSSIKYKPENPLAFGNRGECYRKLGQLQNALDDLNEANRLDPKDDLILANRASTNYELGNLDQAIADLGAAIELNPSNVSYYVNRAGFYTMNKKYAQALIDIKKAKTMGWSDPDNLEDQIIKIQATSKN